MPRYSKWSPLLRRHHQNPVCTSVLHTCHMLCPSHSSVFYLFKVFHKYLDCFIFQRKDLITSLHIVILSSMLSLNMTISSIYFYINFLASNYYS
jgi:hypothetical protein